MVDGVVLRGLDETGLLQGSDEPWQIFRNGMRPAVHGVDVHAKQAEQNELPPEEAEQRSAGKDTKRNEQRGPHGLPQADLRDVPWTMVMEDVLLDGSPDKRRGLGAIPVLRPMNEARDEVDEEVDEDLLINKGVPSRLSNSAFVEMGLNSL